MTTVFRLNGIVIGEKLRNLRTANFLLAYKPVYI